MRIAVVIPMHYFEYHLEAIQSVLQQTRQPDRLIGVYNGHDVKELDRQHEGIREFFEQTPYKDCNFHAVMSVEGNVSAARNVGFHIASETCEWVLPLDEDDALHPQCLERLEYAAQRMPGHGVFYPDWVKFGGGYTSTPEYSFKELKEHPFIISCALISVETWRIAGGYDEELVKKGMRWEDYLFYLAAGAQGVKMARVAPGALVKVRQGGVGTQIANESTEAWYDYANLKLGLDL